METRTKDPKLFHRLVKNNRSNRLNTSMDLYVGDVCMSGVENVLERFRQHFSSLASPEEITTQEDQQYHLAPEHRIRNTVN